LTRALGAGTWDILDINRFNNDWIHHDYRPACASAGAQPGCGDSLQIGATCHHSGL